jgi:hypothetical protein
MIYILSFAVIITPSTHSNLFDAMMMKKLLLCSLILTGFTLIGCVKKEAPKEEEQAEVTPASEVVTPAEPAEFEPLEPVQEAATEEVPATVEIEREQTENTTTEIRREIKKPETAEPAAVDEPATKAVATPAKNNSDSGNKSEEDAVAAAIAAATPALEN